MKKKKLILSLIRDNLVNTKLVLGLTALGLSDSGHYHLHLSETITNLLGIKISDSQYENYLNLYSKAVEIDIVEHAEQLDALAEKIYNELILLNR